MFQEGWISQGDECATSKDKQQIYENTHDEDVIDNKAKLLDLEKEAKAHHKDTEGTHIVGGHNQTDKGIEEIYGSDKA
eukprot:3937974-Heterocapsa_arctica.AAC.1